MEVVAVITLVSAEVEAKGPSSIGKYQTICAEFIRQGAAPYPTTLVLYLSSTLNEMIVTLTKAQELAGKSGIVRKVGKLLRYQQTQNSINALRRHLKNLRINFIVRIFPMDTYIHFCIADYFITDA